MRLSHGSNENALPSGEADIEGLVVRQYVAAIYWAAYTLTTTGYGDITAQSQSERCFNILVFLEGTAVYASVLTHLHEIVTQVKTLTQVMRWSH